MSLKTHEVLRLWRLPAGSPVPSSEAGETSSLAYAADGFELVVDPALGLAPAAPLPLSGPRALRPSLSAPSLTHEVSVGDSIHGILSALEASGVSVGAAELMRRARFHAPGIDLDRLRPGTVLEFGPVQTARAPTQAELRLVT